MNILIYLCETLEILVDDVNNSTSFVRCYSNIIGFRSLSFIGILTIYIINK